MAASYPSSKQAIIDKIVAEKLGHYQDEGLIICDVSESDHPIVFVNHAFELITGYSSEEVLGKNCRFLQREDTLQAEISRISDAVLRGEFYSAIIRNYTKDGMMFWNKLSLYPYSTIESDEYHFYIGIQRNVSHVIQQDEKIRYLHFHDINTGLYNYLGFYEISNERIHQQRGQSQVKFVCLAVCQVLFIPRRDEPSEFEIDRILRHISMEFRLHFYAEDIIAKLKGNQFAFTLFTVSDDKSWILSKMKTIENRVNAILMFSCKVRLKNSIVFENIFQPIYLDQLISKAISVIEIA